MAGDVSRQNGKLGGRKKGSSGAVRKEKLSNLFESVLESADPRKVLKGLLKSDPKEYIRQYISLLPKETKVDGNLNIFSNLTDEELNKYIADGLSDIE